MGKIINSVETIFIATNWVQCFSWCPKMTNKVIQHVLETFGGNKWKHMFLLFPSKMNDVIYKQHTEMDNNWFISERWVNNKYFKIFFFVGKRMC